MSASIRFRKETIFQDEPAERSLCAVGDLNRDGMPEIVIGVRAPRAHLYWLGLTDAGEWHRHEMDSGFETIEAGGCLWDIDGDGDLDLIAGQDGRGDRLFWWECPDDPKDAWKRREIFNMPANKSHDQLVADIDGDGRAELFFWNQGSEALFWVPIPDDPRMSPWPDVRSVVTGVAEEGLAVADVDGDGRLELIAGQSWYRFPRNSHEPWERYEFAKGYVASRVVAADFDGDGHVEIVLAEGDASLNGRDYGRVAVFHAGDNPEGLWREKVLLDQLLDPHSLEVGDFDGDGQPDLFVGEMGLPRGYDPHPPAQRIFWNRSGQLQEQIISAGLGTHESKLLLLDDGLGIVMKPFRVLNTSAPRAKEVDEILLLRLEREV